MPEDLEASINVPSPSRALAGVVTPRRLDAYGVVWRNYLDWAVANVPHYLRPGLLVWMTLFFYFYSAPVRRAVVRNLAGVLPGSSTLMNHLRAFRVLHHYAQTISDAADFRVNQAEFDYEIEGADSLAQLGAAPGAIVLTAHMGNYDLGAALFARKFQRELVMVRAPEPDRAAGRHLDSFVQETGAGAVRIAYNTEGAHLAFDLVQALRRGEIISIQGDRVLEGSAAVVSRMFGAKVRVPSGPFILAQVAAVPIFPLFIVRRGHHRYRIIVRAPMQVTRSGPEREQGIEAAAAAWCGVLEEMIAANWAHWFAFSPIFANAA